MSLISHSFQFIGSISFLFFSSSSRPPSPPLPSSLFLLHDRFSTWHCVTLTVTSCIGIISIFFKSVPQILAQEMNPGVLYKYMMPFNGKPLIAPPLFATGNTLHRKIFNRTHFSKKPSTMSLLTFNVAFKRVDILLFSQDPSIVATKSLIRMRVLASRFP